MTFKIDWSKLMSPALLARHEAEKAEIERLHSLPDRWLAEALLRLAREAREAAPALQNPFDITYGPNFVCNAIPEAARRLGGRLLPNESLRPEYRAMSPQDFRAILGVYLKNTSMRYHDQTPDHERLTPTAFDILDREFVNGNPVAMAADRICPPPEPGNDRDDWIARHVREISGRRGHAETAVWSPALNRDPEPSAEMEEEPTGMSP